MRLIVTRDDYFDAAMALLAKDGAGKLKIGTLCKAIKVTTGSFYGYFGSFDGFVQEFLKHWEQAQTERIAQAAVAAEDPAARIHLLKELASGLPHDAEAAIRSWAHTNADVAAAQKRVDARRLELLTNLLAPAVQSRNQAARLAMIGVTLLVGLQQWRAPVTKKDFDLLFDEYEQLVLNHATGHAATAGAVRS